MDCYLAANPHFSEIGFQAQKRESPILPMMAAVILLAAVVVYGHSREKKKPI